MVTVTVAVLPSGCVIATVTFWPGAMPATSLPSTPVMMSPGLMPAAAAVGIRDLAVADDLAGDISGGVGGDGEPDADGSPAKLGIGGCRCRDADHLAIEARQRAAAGLAVPVVATGAAVEFLADVHAAARPGHRRAATSATEVERCMALTVSVRDGSPHPVAA
ncbi:MAG: hypothetical protein JWM17_286 [Actinobacteria bacterium]|nr:hypothetical protein [Actinomycetota bacterium]MCW3042145.1 hypothetical protein [Actinomycetota bacterium]